MSIEETKETQHEEVTPGVTPEPTTPKPEQSKPQPPEKQKLSQEVFDQVAIEQLEESKRAGLPTQAMLGTMEKFAAYCVNTGQMPKTIDTAAKAIITFQMGRELNIPPMKSLYSFYFVNNKLTMYGPTVVERIRMWAKIEYGLCNAEEATVTITRKDDNTSLSSTVTMKDLTERGITGGKDTFKKHPKTMLIYKAVGEIVRHIVPEAVGAAGVEGDFDETIVEDTGRKGKTMETVTAEDVTIVKDSQEVEIPTHAYIMRNYSDTVIRDRLISLNIEIPEKVTKTKMAEMLRDALMAGVGVDKSSSDIS